MSEGRPSLAFVSPVFLFPNDAGGKIRTTNILRGLKGGAFDVTLIGPADAEQRARWKVELEGVCERFVAWDPPRARPRALRALDLFDPLPVNVVADRHEAALATVRHELNAHRFDLVVFDFVHAAVLMPPALDMPSLCFTHNVETEIFARHAQQTRQPLMRRVWASQAAKMERYERDVLRRFDTVVAVSERDAAAFRERFGLDSVGVIPTGVDLDFFSWAEPPVPSASHAPTVVFVGSMDWAANIDGVEFFIDEVWPRVLAKLPQARFVVVGRNPSAAVVERARKTTNVEFTGRVDDVRPHVHRAQAFVIPLRVGSGTRIKAFEAMAMGCPVVSTAIGVEGLDVVDETHYLCRDGAAEQATAVLQLLTDAPLRRRLSQEARACVEARFGHRVAADVFERHCLETMKRGA